MATKLTAAQLKDRNTKRAAQAAFVFGAVASMAANVYASQHTVVGVVTGLWPAVALLVTVHLLENAPRVTWIKVVAIGIAVVAAWASYWHLVDVFTDGGADAVSAHLLPLTVDAMMAVATAVLNKKAPARRPARKPAAKVAPVRKLRAA